MVASGELFRSLGESPVLTPQDLRMTVVPALLVSGAADPVVSAEETLHIGTLLEAKSLLFPGAAHPIAAMPLARVAECVSLWIAGVEAERRSRFRRRVTSARPGPAPAPP